MYMYTVSSLAGHIHKYSTCTCMYVFSKHTPHCAHIHVNVDIILCIHVEKCKRKIHVYTVRYMIVYTLLAIYTHVST